MVRKFANYPLYAKGIIFFYTAGFLTMTIYHIAEVFQMGFFSRDVPFIINIWYDALGFIIVPAVLILLYTRPKAGLLFALAVTAITFVLDALVRYIIQDESYVEWFYFFEITFAILVITTFPIMRFLVKPKTSEKHYA